MFQKKENNKYKKVDPWNLAIETIEGTIGIIKVAVSIPLAIAILPFSFFSNDHEKVVKKDIKLKILSCLLTSEGFDKLDDRELKIACHILNSPWIVDKRDQTIAELRKIFFNTQDKKKYTEMVKKYVDVLTSYQIYHLRKALAYHDPYMKKWEKEDMTLKIFMRKKLKEKWIERILYIYEECWHKNITEYKKEIESSEAESEAGKLFSNISLYFSSLYNAILSTDDLSKELNDLTKNLFEDTDTIYKKAVDANYASDKSAYGGPYHRLFDDSHSIGKMYEKIKDAKPDDSKLEEIFAWVNEAAKDFQTTMGLPIVSMNKETFDSMASFLKPVGINKNDLYDVLTGNLQEFLGAAFLGITSLIPSIKKDKKRLRSLKGVMVASGAFGNPFALILLLMTLVYSMVKGDTKQFKEDLMSKEAISGFAITAIIKYAFDYLGTKIVLTILGLLLALMLVVYFFRHRKNITVNLENFKKKFVEEFEKLKETSKNLLEKENIKPLPEK
jgi:hypothetical protein